jgi:2-polyprenyl-3-methyl-5-hydroxy-6-metoxy-1,4-benzoquinol methylase
MELDLPVHEGVVHAAYAGSREDVAALVPAAARRVLDVGCSTGALGEYLGTRGHEVTGLEVEPTLAAEARPRLRRVVEADVEVLARSDTDMGGPFDCVVFADVLEHLRDPWAVVRWGAGLLAEGGSVVISVPNVRHIRLVRTVLRHRHWPYDQVGIFDRTHLRWFAFRNLPELLEGTGLSITELRRTRAVTIRPADRVNRLAPLMGDFGTLQFLFRAERTRA